MSHLSCYLSSQNQSTGIFYSSNTLIISAKSGRDIPTRLTLSPWNATCSNIPFNSVKILKVSILDCTTYDPSFLVDFTRLTSLEMEHIGKPIPMSIMNNMTSLTSLKLSELGSSHNVFLNQLCETTSVLGKLQKLDIDGIQDSIVPISCIGQKSVNMIELALTGMRNTTFGELQSGMRMYKLRKLNFSNNHLELLPDFEADFLTTLDISNNLLTSIDNPQYPHLKTLIAHHNFITVIPEWFNIEVQKQYTDMSYNQLESFISNEFNRGIVDLSGNSWLLDNGVIECSYSVELMILDNVHVNSINDISKCSNNIRIRNSTIRNVEGLKIALSGKDIDMTYSNSYLTLLEELCMDSGTPKTITTHKNITLPKNCISSNKTELTIKYDYNSCNDYPLRNLTTGIWQLTCIEPTIPQKRQCLKEITTGSSSLSSYRSSSSLMTKYTYKASTYLPSTTRKQNTVEIIHFSTMINNTVIYRNYTHTRNMTNSTEYIEQEPPFYFEVIDASSTINSPITAQLPMQPTTIQNTTKYTSSPTTTTSTTRVLPQSNKTSSPALNTYFILI